MPEAVKHRKTKADLWNRVPDLIQALTVLSEPAPCDAIAALKAMLPSEAKVLAENVAGPVRMVLFRYKDAYFYWEDINRDPISIKERMPQCIKRVFATKVGLLRYIAKGKLRTVVGVWQPNLRERGQPQAQAQAA